MKLFKILLNLFSIKKQLSLNADSERLDWITKQSKIGTIEFNKPSYKRNFELIFYPYINSNVSYKFLGNNLRKVIDIAMTDKDLNILIKDIENSYTNLDSKKSCDTNTTTIIHLPIKPNIGDVVHITNCNENTIVNFKD